MRTMTWPRMRRGVALLVATGIALAGCATATEPTSDAKTSTPAANPLDSFYTQPVDWSECGGGFECAEVMVPLDYDSPDGATIVLPLTRLPARDADMRIGSLLINPGGPGASGAEYARSARTSFTEEVRAAYDVVGFDPRGIAGSDPAIDCYDDEELDEYLAGDPTPDNAKEIDALLASREAFIGACLDRSGYLLEHVGTDDVARDLDVIRAALGDDELYYLGKSYGTAIGAEYIRQFPDTVGRVVVDGVLDPTLDATGLALGQSEGIERALTAFAEECAATTCAVGDDVDGVRASVDRVLADADADPLPTSLGGRVLTESAAFEGIILPLYLAPEQGYPLLEQGIAQALGGDGSLLLSLSDAYRARGEDGTYDGNQNQAIGIVNCADRGGSGTVEDVQQALPDYVAVSPTFGETLAWSELGCEGLPDSQDVSPGPVDGAGAAPILVVGTAGDLATPYEWAESLAGQLESGVLLTYDSTPHTAYRQGSECIDEAVDGYLLTGEPPADDTVCQ